MATAEKHVAAADARTADVQNALELERRRAEAAEAACLAAQADACSLQGATAEAHGAEPALIGVPNVGLTSHLGACVIALRHIRSFCGLMKDDRSTR